MNNKHCGSTCRYLVFFLLPFLLCISCYDQPSKQPVDVGKKENKNAIQQKPPGSFSDTVTIDFPAAVFYNPDSLQLEKIKAVTGKMIFESTVHDCFFQMRNSRIVLKKYYPGIKIIEVKNARYLLFKKVRGEKEYIDLNTKNDPCGIFIFDGVKHPSLVDMTNIDSDLGFYFSK